MSFKFLLALLSVLGISLGQLMLKIGVSTANSTTASSGHALLTYANIYLLFGLILLALSTCLWMYVLKFFPLSAIYPLMALAFVLVPVFSRFFLKEHVSVSQWLGIALIVCGVWVTQSTK
jgi:uncharacterized membrane protein